MSCLQGDCLGEYWAEEGEEQVRVWRQRDTLHTWTTFLYRAQSGTWFVQVAAITDQQHE